ncbi:HAMP domain-containing sensor histidine kinase [Saxibacter everestensis]|uniref:Sensor-like histidine kinase SenX3 n=1 Tax=Saxibacter everestensis TaxID=2909229 RepID=A0ABY8QUF2_9MICO|nr:HAMP domain-containing sensor histidine kinase [Brevibacteriaceae bacterium ZFBP1038]
MTNTVIVVRIEVWLFVILALVVLLAAAALVWWLIRRGRNQAQKAAIQAAAAEQHEATVRRNRMLIRLDHELKNPLTVLRTSAVTLRDMLADGSATAEDLDMSLTAISSSSNRVARLLADLRKLADVETRQIDYLRVDMATLVEQAVEDARTAPGAEGRRLVASVARAPWKLPDVIGEEDLILSAILNLIGNALKYSSADDVVEIRASEQVVDDVRWVVIEVADTGMGIPAGEQMAVWEELARGQSVRAVPGSGMGLALVRSIVLRHGGKVELRSQQGDGTAVRMLLPALIEAEAQPGAGPTYPNSAGAARSR